MHSILVLSSNFHVFEHFILLVRCIASFSFNLRIEMNFNLIKCIVGISVLHISNGIFVPAARHNRYVEVFWCWRLHEFNLWATFFVAKLIKTIHGIFGCSLKLSSNGCWNVTGPAHCWNIS